MSATIIIGKHAVKQCLKSGAHIEKVFVRQRQKSNDDIRQIIASAKKQKVLVQWLESHRFDERFEGDHQGIACITHDFNQCSIDDIIQQTPRIVLVLDHILIPITLGPFVDLLKHLGFTYLLSKRSPAQITPSVKALQELFSH